MNYYASATGTKRNLARIREALWRLMITPFGNGPKGFPFAVDNGAYRAHQQGVEFARDPFLRLLDRHGDAADWVVVPDIVASPGSLEFSLPWLDTLRGLPLLLAVQDGMTPEDVEPHLDAIKGIFIGGTTGWKESTMARWCEMPCYVHVGRVNSQRRFSKARLCGADSCDGSGVSKWAVHAGVMQTVSDQSILPLERT